MAQNKHYEEYEHLVQETDQLCLQLETRHNNHMACRSGCDLCCIDYSILPVEFYAIREKLRAAKVKPLVEQKTDNEACIFLQNHTCTIYPMRPLICRTHGLPLLFVNEDDEWELSACELNFTKFDYNRFNEKNTFPQDRFNSKLFMLNKKFISDFDEVKYDVFDLVPIKNLATQL